MSSPPSSAQLADIASTGGSQGARARPRSAGGAVVVFEFRRVPMGKDGQRVRDAVAFVLDPARWRVEYDGEMSADDVALNERLMRQLYPSAGLRPPGQHPRDARTAQCKHCGKAAARARRRDGGRPAPPRAVAPGPNRQHGRDGVRPGQSRRPLGARRDPLIAKSRHCRRGDRGRSE